jgi:hypothetical protein
MKIQYYYYLSSNTYGLAAAVFTTNLDNAIHISNTLRYTGSGAMTDGVEF